MFFSLALILLAGLAFGWICTKLHLPALTGMILAGILIGPCCLNWIDPQTMDLSANLRKIALLIILARAGLNLKLGDLKRAGLPALLMTFVPATFEILGCVLLAPVILGLDVVNSALLGTVIGAVSPAVIVPRMIRLIKEGYGTKEAVPQMILAGASMDDIYVIVLFSAFCTMAQTGNFDALSLLQIPVSILLGIAGGWLCAKGMAWLYQKVQIQPVIQVIQFYGIAFLLTAVEDLIGKTVPFSSLLAVMSCALFLARMAPKVAANISKQSDSLWSCAQIFLFVLVGAEVSLSYALNLGLKGILLLVLVLVIRMAGVWVCMAVSRLDSKSRLFCMLSYTPKATVQAAIGAVPLAMGLASGSTILTMAVLSILLTAPLGAWAMDLTYKKLLKKSKRQVVPHI